VRPEQVGLRQPSGDHSYDFAARVGPRTFVIEVAARGDRQTLSRKWERLRSAGAVQAAIPIVVVPFMAESGRAFCAADGINWLDLSGNGSIQVEGLAYQVQGLPNRYAKRGRPVSVFERRSSRLARLLLQRPGRTWFVRECAHLTNLDPGHVSRIVARLVQDELLVREEGNGFRVAEPLALLEAWRSEADFSKHRNLPGHVAARSGEELLRALSEGLGAMGVKYAATGLCAAWMYDHFAMFRLVTLYVGEWFTDAHLDQLHFRHSPAGANVWLVLPNDDGVYEGMRAVDSIPCVHPIQVYVDLKDQPERAAEASEHLRTSPVLLGGQDGA